MTFHTSSSASWNACRSMPVAHQVGQRARRRPAAGVVLGGAPRAGSAPPQLRATSDSDRCARLPRSFASSTLIREMIAWWLRLPSAPNGLLAQQEIADLVQAEGRDQLPRLDHVAERLAHLLAVDHPPAVGRHPLRHRQPGRHQERRPIDRMETDDVLADEMHIRRPERPARRGLIREAAGGDVVVQRVQPDIHHVRRERPAPGCPSVKLVRLIDRSRSPPRTKLMHLVAA